jgi:hypothetical protein
MGPSWRGTTLFFFFFSHSINLANVVKFCQEKKNYIKKKLFPIFSKNFEKKWKFPTQKKITALEG